MPGYFWLFIPIIFSLILVWAVREWRLTHHTVKSQTRGVSDAWVDILTQNVPLYAHMPVDLQQMDQSITLRFLEHKKLVPCGGIDELTEEMKVTIAGQAALLRLAREFRYPYEDVYTVLVYPAEFFHSAAEEHDFLTGEDWPTGSVVVAWDAASHTCRALRLNTTVSVRDFAAQLELPEELSYAHRTWSRLLEPEFTKLQPAALERYHSDDPTEFFAVATEAFLARNPRLAKDHAELYAALRTYYRVDPPRWRY